MTNHPDWNHPAYLNVTGRHRMAYRCVGRADGEPWLVVHGGPGGGCQPGALAPLSLSRHRIVAPDQRGCGASRPAGCTGRNNTAALVSDLERLRKHLGIERWSILAGSWGTVVALLYAQRYPQRVQRLVLRGAFALRREEVGGLLLATPRLRGAGLKERHWPAAPGVTLPVVLKKLGQVLQSGTLGVTGLSAVRGWQWLEVDGAARGMRRVLRHPETSSVPGSLAAARRGWASMQRLQRKLTAQLRRPGARRADRSNWKKFRIQGHYLAHRGFVRPGRLDAAVKQLAHQGVPIDWVHGRFDAVCPPKNSRRWSALGGREAPELVSLTEPCCGHLGGEPAMLAALRARVQEGFA
jgi:proline iminopeptidase